MILYLTFQESTQSSIYKTQVLDVVSYLRDHVDEDVRILAFIQPRNYFRERKRIREQSKVPTYTLPQLPFPRMHLWKWNALTLLLFCWFRRPSVIMCRSIFAGWLGLAVKKPAGVRRIVFDSRGIITEEAREYGIYPPHVVPTIAGIEKHCALHSDFLMVITERMITYYRDKFGYQGTEHVVIPCTIGEDFEDLSFDVASMDEVRSGLGYSADDVVVVYSGSNAKWQSFDLMLQFAERLLLANANVKLLLLTAKNDLVEDMLHRYPERVTCAWLSNDKVRKHLAACDHALMVRDHTVTNSVCSPTKFGEYLACGLPVIVNDSMAITDLVKEQEVGHVVTDLATPLRLERVDLDRKHRIREVAERIFSKRSAPIIRDYRKAMGLP